MRAWRRCGRSSKPPCSRPDAEEWLDTDPEPVVHYAEREARIAMFTPQAWRERYAPQAAHTTEGQCEKLERAFEFFQARQRQFAAVLEAHGIPVTFVYCDANAGRARRTLARHSRPSVRA